MITRAPRPKTNFYLLDKAISEEKRLGWAARGTNTKNIALDGLSVVRLLCREKIAAGIGVLNGAVKSCLAHTVVCSFFASSAQFLAARTRGDESHRRCSIGTPTSSRAASPIGVGRR